MSGRGRRKSVSGGHDDQVPVTTYAHRRGARSRFTRVSFWTGVGPASGRWQSSSVMDQGVAHCLHSHEQRASSRQNSQIPIELGFLDDPPISPRHNLLEAIHDLLRLADTGTDDLRVCVKASKGLHSSSFGNQDTDVS